ncbi:MAG TPA: helix-turn-helix domain-containing protein [Pseudomonas lactis]|jgi:phage repressor protein C with HTH and peptisase S24 domain|uniref:Helix-turn-helix domain-containing protein n=1 Tax=Pseudomonas lactis TaxID=1615674 RepID=A0A921NNI8_9PSED|nr:S24 family peptidase [Pseudomonas lactis]HJH21624.1 helix-turn-helix domain-containing protein [Pseudomonas lactis]
MEFKDRVTQRMKALSLTATDISKLTGVSKATVSFWVSGINGAKGKNLLALAKALECSPDWLSEGTGTATDSPSTDTPKAGSSSADLVAHMLATKAGKNLSEKAREMMLAAAAEADSPAVNGQAYAPGSFAALRPSSGEILIPQYDVRASLGDGQLPPDYNEAIRNLVVREDLLREKGVSYTSNTSLAMITGWGQSMEGTIEDKDPVIVDRGIKDYQGEGVYLLTWHSELFIKRLQRMDEDHVWLISDNRKNKDQKARIEDVSIHAKVLMVWNARKL